MRWTWFILLALATLSGCQSLPAPYEGAGEDAEFLFGGKWQLKPSEAEQ